MIATEQDLRELLSQAHALPRGPARFAALDAVFRHADAAGNVAFAFDARMGAINDFHHGGDPTRAFLAFSWCLSVFDRQPELVAAHHERTLLWRFKWIVWALPQFPDIPLDRTIAVLDDMQRRYQLGGHSLHAVYQHRWLVAHHIGDVDAAQTWYDKMLTARRDSLSDCRACVPSSQVRHLSSLGRFEEAITIGEPFKNGGCTEQPQWILAELLMPYLHTGRLDEAVQAHRNGYQRIRDDRHHLDNIGQHLMFAGLTGNEARGLEILERHLTLLDRPSSPYAAMEFASAAALVLDRLCADGQGDLTLRRRSDDNSRRWESTVTEVHGELVARARGLAIRFDARNGNSHQSERIEARMSAQPVVTRLPLTVLAGRATSGGRARPDARLTSLVDRVAELTAAGDQAGAARARLGVAHSLRNAGRWEDAVEAAEEAVRMLERARLDDDATRCRYLLWQLYSKAHHHRSDALAILDEIRQVANPPAPVPPLEVLLEEAADLLRGSEAIPNLLSAADLHHATATTPAELRVLRKALVMLSFQPPTDLARATLARADALAATNPDGTADEKGLLDAAAALILAADGHVEDAITRIDGAIAQFHSRGLSAERSNALLQRARLLLRAGRAAEAEAQAREVLRDSPDHGWAASLTIAKALQKQGRNDDAYEFMAKHEIEDYDLDDDE